MIALSALKRRSTMICRVQSARRPTAETDSVSKTARARAAKRLHMEQLPGYAPDLNSDKGVRNYLHRVAFANICCHQCHDRHLCRELPELRIQVIARVTSARSSTRAPANAVTWNSSQRRGQSFGRNARSYEELRGATGRQVQARAGRRRTRPAQCVE